ncbi:MAG: biopolymer transporter ExbD [Kiritimatiellae bacterium]|nr:biopolymer transporter ExbD [Kiritimatiellia bacterium]
MIDVVFQLMIFFVITIKQDDIFARLNANRPAPGSGAASDAKEDSQIKIDIGPGGLLLNQRGMNSKQFDEGIAKLAKTSKDATVLVRCTLDSPHHFLVEALDVCNKYGMYNLSIFSM